jgi:hypothetical protein
MVMWVVYPMRSRLLHTRGRRHHATIDQQCISQVETVSYIPCS